ncbi:MAG: MBL fold metallo-hydrolase [Spirochaetia bacterium]|nr:MBL fold metallo-hydrolase [Spirochaetia bacterium]
MKIIFLGSGTSSGVPVIKCSCLVCSSKDEKDRRMRASILVEKRKRIVIDTGPDFRFQMLEHSIQNLDAALYTHLHYDHIGGMDDLRPFSLNDKQAFPVWADKKCRDEIINKYSYVEQTAGKISNRLPNLQINILKSDKEGEFAPFNIGDIEIQPVRLVHAPQISLDSVGFIFDKKFGYLTDFKTINAEDEKYLYNLKLLVLGAPLPFETSTHISMEQAKALIHKFRPERAFITHISHDVLHRNLEKNLSSDAPPIYPAYDGLSLFL